MLLQQRCSANDSPHFSPGSAAWRAGALHREVAVPVSERQRCSSPTGPRTARDGPLQGWPASVPACQQVAKHTGMRGVLPLIVRSEGKD